MTNLGFVLFVSEDLCSRTAVLATVGYQVLCSECDATAVVDALLQTPVDAVLFHCDPKPPSHLILAATRAATDAPVVLFARGSSSYNEDEYDVIVPALCSPGEWLPPLTEAVALHRHPDHKKPSRAVTIDSPRNRTVQRAKPLL